MLLRRFLELSDVFVTCLFLVTFACVRSRGLQCGAPCPRCLADFVCAWLQASNVFGVRRVCKAWRVFSPMWATVNDEENLRVAQLAAVRRIVFRRASVREETWQLISQCHGLTSADRPGGGAQLKTRTILNVAAL